MDQGFDTFSGSLVISLLVYIFLVILKYLRAIMAAREYSFDPPQAILVLGGDKHREQLAARFAAGEGPGIRANSTYVYHTKLLPVFLSSGHDDARNVMKRAGVNPRRLRVDDRALDTVTNFTSLVTTFKDEGLSHVYVVTSDYHVKRAMLLATIILGAAGIAYTLIRLPSKEIADSEPRESRVRLERDRIRAILWLLTGWHGAELLRYTKPNRYREHKKRQKENKQLKIQ